MVFAKSNNWNGFFMGTNFKSKRKFLQYFLICMYIGLSSVRVNGQDVHYNNLLLMVSDRSYIQFMRGNLPTRNQNTELRRANFMEAQIAPNYFIRFGDSSRFALAISPKIILRMGGGESFPIKTPSFMPNITGFYGLRSKNLSENKVTKWLIKPEHRLFLMFRAAHHSNGQKDEFFVQGTKRINFSTGNFSTDYIEVGFQWVDMSGGKNGFSVNGRISVEQHIQVTREKDLKEIYYNQRLLFENEFNLSEYVQLSTRFEVMLGNGSLFTTKTAFHSGIEYQPFRRLSDISFFVKSYIGPDYYNIRYFSNQNFIGLGVRANPNQKNVMIF
jgi:hypothetical protein